VSPRVGPSIVSGRTRHQESAARWWPPLDQVYNTGSLEEHLSASNVYYTRHGHSRPSPEPDVKALDAWKGLGLRFFFFLVFFFWGVFFCLVLFFGGGFFNRYIYFCFLFFFFFLYIYNIWREHQKWLLSRAGPGPGGVPGTYR